jgi:hypothetical protein
MKFKNVVLKLLLMLMFPVCNEKCQRDFDTDVCRKGAGMV